jgi:hypothetical protein
MLVPDDELERACHLSAMTALIVSVPMIPGDAEILESQAASRIADLPDAFQPEMLAALEPQCRTFLK